MNKCENYCWALCICKVNFSYTTQTQAMQLLAYAEEHIRSRILYNDQFKKYDMREHPNQFSHYLIPATIPAGMIFDVCMYL